MRKTHTILIPSMLEFHMTLFEGILKQCNYKVEVLHNEGPEVIEEGLKYVHNDTCYPATLVIGQFIDALNHRDDLDRVVLLITQTGGGCRASNYIHLLRKALKKSCVTITLSITPSIYFWQRYDKYSQPPNYLIIFNGFFLNQNTDFYIPL